MKTLQRTLLLFALLAGSVDARSQTIPTFDPPSADSIETFTVGGLDAGGYIDTYFAYELGNSDQNTRQALSFSQTTNNQFALNLGAITLKYEGPRYRGNLAVGAGSYVARTVSGAYSPLNNVLEANVGVLVRKNLWLDAGVIPVQWGIESPYSFSQLNLTRSLTAEAAPYFQTGAKLTYTSGRMTYAAIVSNGWQITQDVNKDKTFGTQIQYNSTNKKLTLNYSTATGNERPSDLDKRTRTMHYVYAIYAPSDRLQLQAQGDFGHEDKSGNWYGAFVSARQFLTGSLALGGRLERFVDKNAIVAPSVIKANGASVNLDYYVQTNALLRIEARTLLGPEAQNSFVKEGHAARSNSAITASLTAKF